MNHFVVIFPLFQKLFETSHTYVSILHWCYIIIVSTLNEKIILLGSQIRHDCRNICNIFLNPCQIFNHEPKNPVNTRLVNIIVQLSLHFATMIYSKTLLTNWLLLIKFRRSSLKAATIFFVNFIMTRCHFILFVVLLLPLW